MYNTELSNFIKILKEERDSCKFYMKDQLVQSIVVEITSLFVYLYPDLHI